METDTVDEIQLIDTDNTAMEDVSDTETDDAVLDYTIGHLNAKQT